MSLPNFEIKAWSDPTFGSAGVIQKFGDPDKDHEFNILQIWRLFTNMYHKQMVSKDLAAPHFDIQGSYASRVEIKDNPIWIDILKTAITSELSSNVYPSVRLQLDLLFPTTRNVALEEDVVKEFSSIPEVKSIIAEISSIETIFIVFISSSIYDDDLMDSLLTKEIEILERFAKNTFSFRYLPFVSQDFRNNQLSSRAKILFGG
jgi:hypothetical protein